METVSQRKLDYLLIQKAGWAGQDAAIGKLAELAAAGPKYTVHENGFGEPQTLENMVGVMLDVCGGGWLVVDGRSPGHRRLKKLFPDERCYEFIGGLRASYSIGWPKGYALSLHGMHNRQEMSVAVAALEAAAQVLRDGGIECRVHSYID